MPCEVAFLCPFFIPFQCHVSRARILVAEITHHKKGPRPWAELAWTLQPNRGVLCWEPGPGSSKPWCTPKGMMALLLSLLLPHPRVSCVSQLPRACSIWTVLSIYLLFFLHLSVTPEEAARAALALPLLAFREGQSLSWSYMYTSILSSWLRSQTHSIYGPSSFWNCWVPDVFKSEPFLKNGLVFCYFRLMSLELKIRPSTSVNPDRAVMGTFFMFLLFCALA